jgi:hypothetical protein
MSTEEKNRAGIPEETEEVVGIPDSSSMDGKQRGGQRETANSCDRGSRLADVVSQGRQRFIPPSLHHGEVK